MEKKPYICPKCSNHQYKIERLSMFRGNIARLFNVSNKQFHTVCCTKCGYTEFYQLDSDIQFDCLYDTDENDHK